MYLFVFQLFTLDAMDFSLTASFYIAVVFRFFKIWEKPPLCLFYNRGESQFKPMHI